MRTRRVVAVLCAVAATMAGVSVTASAQESGQPASEIGVTADAIRIAVVADVENQFRPGLFAASPDALRAFAKYVNRNGGIAGRRLVVDFIDSHLSPDEARSAIIRACENDFAMVGTAALFLNNVEPMVSCVDKAGAATGLPDLPIAITETAHQCSPVTYSINPSQLDCATQDESPQTFRGNQGPYKFYERTRSKDLKGPSVHATDVRAAAIAGQALGGVAKAAGVDVDEVGVSALATQAEYTPVIQQAKADGANWIQNTSDFATAVKLRTEAKVQGLDSESIVWDCLSNCYDQQLIEQGGADVEGQYAIINQLPFSETKQNKQLANYVKGVGKNEVSGFGAYAWITGLLFRDTVNKVVEEAGENGLTRKAFLDALAQTTSFDATGMWGTTDIGNRVGTPCFIMMQVQDGAFERIYPKKAGTFDCKKSNSITFEADLLD